MVAEGRALTTGVRSRLLARGTDGGTIRRSVLPGGLRVITESMPGVHSATFGVWVGVGSRDETPRLGGASHFLEHLLFKGTRRRSALQIAAEIDAVGGELNAFTGKESTCFYAHVIDRDLPLAVDVVSDVLTNAVIAAGDVDNERGVILEEIAMRDDDPGDAVHDLFSEVLFGDHPLGRPVIGSVQTIEALSRSQIAGFYRRRYRPQTMVVAAAGNVEHRQVLRLVAQAFGKVLGAPAEPDPPRVGVVHGLGRPARSVGVLHRSTEQAHVVLGSAGLDRFDERRYALGVLNNALGGGMSSRLFQEVRERRGLAYSVYSFASQYAGGGSFGVYAGCQPSRTHEVLSIVRDEMAAVAAEGITEEEVERGKGQFRGGLVLGLEDTGSRMSRIGKHELTHGEHVTVPELLARIEAVTVDEVRQLAGDLLNRPMCLAVVGPFAEDEFDGEL
ncbi:MAG: insulinase family protein [Geodermatophilaceae bacterium]|nr:insulinase family protein [Geodermatophilaceae bacterium]